MDVLLKIVVLLGLIGIPLSLAKPKLILFKMENPKRWQAAAVAAVSWLVLLVIVAPGTKPPQEQTVPAQQAPVATAPQQAPAPTTVAAPPPKPVPKGIGISRAQVVALMGSQGCPLAESTEVDGQERWQGNEGIVLCEVTGPAAEVQKVFLLHGVAKDAPQTALDAILKINEVVKLAAPGWPDSGKWVVAAVTNEGDVIVRNGRRIEVKLFPGLGLGVSVQAAQ